jgi:iron complex outermembrane receptor protein
MYRVRSTVDFVYSPPAFITMAATFIPFLFASDGRRLSSTASERWPFLLCRENTTLANAAPHKTSFEGGRMRIQKSVGVRSFWERFVTKLSGCASMGVFAMPPRAQRAPAPSLQLSNRNIKGMQSGEGNTSYSTRASIEKRYSLNWRGGRVKRRSDDGLRATKRARRLARLVGLVLSIWGVAAVAQTSTTTAATQPDPTLAEVVVTGSRIVAPNAVSTSPIQVVTAKELQQGGKTDAIDFLNQLPQNFQNAQTDLSNNSSGLNTPGGVTVADLRGLGPQRTLVLINGRRLGVGDPNTANPNPSPDLDQIPISLVERVDVVTGGASATYGSDAIAGVINFIMKKNFEGIEIGGQLSEYQHNNHETGIQNLESVPDYGAVTGNRTDGRTRTFNLLMGTNIADGKGNVTAYFDYRNAAPVVSADRDFGGCQLNLNKALTSVACHGSANSNYFSLANGNAYTVVGNQFLPWPQVGSNPPPEFNSQKYIYMSREDERYSAGFLAHIDINEYVKPYAEFGFMDDKSTEVVAPSGLFQQNPTDPTGNGNFNINCDNPLLSGQQASIICSPAQLAFVAANPSQPCVFPAGGAASPNCANINIGRRNVEGGGRTSYWDHTNYRAVFGATGDFADAWKYDVYGQYYTTTVFTSNTNYLNYAAVNNAFQVTGTAANPTCISGPPCVPWNIFKTGGVTAAQLVYLYAPGTADGTSTERTLHADVSGDLGKYGIKSPLATDGLAVNVGAEHRSDHLDFAPDAAELSGQLAGFGGASVAVNAGTSVKEGFIELRAPLIQDKPGFKDLIVDTGYRYSDYNLSGGVNTYKFELQYAPISDVRFRGGYQRAIRAASVLELYTPQSFGGISQPGIDPCAATRDPNTGAVTAATASLAQCIPSGVTAAEYGNGGTTNSIKQCVALQCSQVQGGNTALKPEQSDSVTFGVNLTPSFAPGLTGSVDFYRIKVTGVVGTISAPVILNNCLATGDPTYCRLIVRDSNGSISGSSVASGGYILQTNINVGAVSVSGIDIQASYRLPLDRWGSLFFNFAGSDLLTNKTTPLPGAPTYNCAGLFGPSCQTVNPRWRHNLRASWETPWSVELTAFWRYIGTTSLDGNSSQPTIGGQPYDAFDAKMPAVSYLDLSAAWRVIENLEIRAGVNNVFDKDPPIVSSNVAPSGAANSFPTYDQLGRQFFAAFKVKF